MSADITNQQIKVMFTGYQQRNTIDVVRVPGTLSSELASVVARASRQTRIAVNASIADLFVTASVEMWHRSVHSFLISVSLTKTSPLWACVSGYYSSHYSIRALAHLLGYFKLHNEKRILTVRVSSNKTICTIEKPDRSGGEHKFYWQKVKQHSRFVNDSFFTQNEARQPQSDRDHRNKANYFDHINQFPKFETSDMAYLEEKVKKIANIQLSVAPIPKPESYPDTDNVQLIAYHRMAKYRMFVNEVLGDSSQFWNAHKNPAWCPSFLDFQILEPSHLSEYKEQLS